MANTSNGNTLYIDSTGTINYTSNIKVLYILLTATSSNAILKLQDVNTLDLKLDLRVSTSGESKLFDFSNTPIFFPNGIIINTLTNATASLIIKKQGVGN